MASSQASGSSSIDKEVPGAMAPARSGSAIGMGSKALRQS
eukprot:CAMPEP_0203913288 /NCGR_PEP_ID=MMETSP0359-20131031/54308_1 /ASSEMBLY_ACC=CAM_ASM_000338 /TAXON_ID=268821 /ORGANISM="Scrippsiella Hangoei, Strain SHTV-5" /LENGTH=39 /DNA_ID= /DNA_START= /DNA_END= /DNA_ORIENTATION=